MRNLVLALLFLVSTFVSGESCLASACHEQVNTNIASPVEQVNPKATSHCHHIEGEKRQEQKQKEQKKDTHCSSSKCCCLISLDRWFAPVTLEAPNYLQQMPFLTKDQTRPLSFSNLLLRPPIA